MAYELWDIVTRNIAETFESEAKALEAAQQLVAVNLGVYPDALALVFEDADGDTAVITFGRGLRALLQSEDRPT